jgi:hypothetical protein
LATFVRSQAICESSAPKVKKFSTMTPPAKNPPAKKPKTSSKKRRDDPQKREQERLQKQAIRDNKKAQHYQTFIPQCILWSTPPVPKQTKSRDAEADYNGSWVKLKYREGSNDLATHFLDRLTKSFLNTDALDRNQVFFTKTNIDACCGTDSTSLLSTPSQMVIGVALLLKFLSLHDEHKSKYQVPQPTLSFTHSSVFVDKFKQDVAALCNEIGNKYTLVVLPSCEFLLAAGVQPSQFYAQMAAYCQMPFGTKFFPPLTLAHHLYYKPFLDTTLSKFKLPSIPEVNLTEISANCHHWKDVPTYLFQNYINEETFRGFHPEWTEDHIKRAGHQGFVFKPHYGTLSVDVFHVRPTFAQKGDDWEAFYPATGRVSKNLEAEIDNMVNLPWHTNESVGAPYRVEPYDINLYYDEVRVFAKVPDVTTTKDPIANYAIQSRPISGRPGYFTPKVYHSSTLSIRKPSHIKKDNADKAILTLIRTVVEELKNNPKTALLFGPMRELPLRFDVFKCRLTDQWMLNEIEAVPECHVWLDGELVSPDANRESRKGKKKEDKPEYGWDKEVLEFANNIYDYLKTNWHFPLVSS